jgi:hypothetical protein
MSYSVIISKNKITGLEGGAVWQPKDAVPLSLLNSTKNTLQNEINDISMVVHGIIQTNKYISYNDSSTNLIDNSYSKLDFNTEISNQGFTYSNGDIIVPQNGFYQSNLILGLETYDLSDCYVKWTTTDPSSLLITDIYNLRVFNGLINNPNYNVNYSAYLVSGDVINFSVFQQSQSLNDISLNKAQFSLNVI